MTELIKYIQNVQEDFSGKLGEIYEAALDENIPVVPKEVAKLLAFLISAKQPKRILEIGCAVGFSASLMAHYCDASIITIDRYEFMIERAKKNFDKLELNHRITLMEGDALEILAELEARVERFDFIFMDAAKGQYVNFFPYCERMLEQGGMLAADDILQNGTITRSSSGVARRQRTTHKRMRDFLKSVCHDERFVSSIVPIGDGMLLAVKK